jgi:transposase InsO family protein
VKFAFIRANAHAFGISVACVVLGVSRCGYYAWLGRPTTPARETRKEELMKEIRSAHAAGRRLYGSPRVHAELAASGVEVCENTVAKYMREAGIRSVTHRRFRVRTTDSNHAHPVAPNVLARDFAADAPDEKWCVDVTYVTTGEGWLYVAAVLDLCSRKVVGWAMADHLRSELCEAALRMAVGNRRPGTGLVHHGDRGVQYCCHAYRALVDRAGMVCSMSGVGDCWDNAAMESFWSTLKKELVYLTEFATRAEAEASIFEFIEVFYNRERRHSSLGYLSPAAYEATLS